MYHRALCIVFVVAVAFISISSGAGVCTGYPKMYNGKPCASTTRYYDNTMGACGCGTGNTSPFSWVSSKPTAAASAPIYGAGSWCGSGCGKCFKLTPTAVGASPVGKGATNLKPLVVKVTNLCPSGGNEEWCAMDVNSHDYDAHFDLMDQNMNGIITAQGWDNPEVTYEEVDCAANGFGDWSCQCASGGSSGSSTATTKPAATTAPTTKPTTKATTAPTKATTAPTTKATTKATTAPTTKATTKPTTKPTTKATTKPTTKATTKPATPSTPVGAPIKVQVMNGVNSHWFGFSVADKSVFSKIEIKDKQSNWVSLSYTGDQHWGMYYINPTAEMTLPLSLRFTSTSGNTVTASNIITSFTAGEVNTKVAL